MVGLHFKKLGPWAWANMSLKMLGPELYASALWGQRKAAERYIKIVKGHIDNQDLGWVPLDRATNSGDDRILVDTEAYRNSIKAYRKGGVYHAGVKRGATNSRGISINDYATAHEHGWGVPRRPLWNLHLERWGVDRELKQ